MKNKSKKLKEEPKQWGLIPGRTYYDIVAKFEKQQEFQTKIKSGIKPGLRPILRNELYRENCLFTIEEIIEGLRFINHKPWKKTKEVDDIDKLKDELVDEFRFFMNRCILVGMGDRELFDRLQKSFGKTEKRLKNNY
jgi:hypothetical protein